METKLELGIDIGTSFSSVANINFSDDQVDVHVLELVGNGGLIPSAVLIDQADKIIAFGQQAIEKYEAGQGKTIIREFKMAMAAVTGFSGTKIEPAYVYKSFLAFIRDEIEKKYDVSIAESRICITHPAVKPTSTLPDNIMRIAEEVFINCDLFHLDEASAVTQFIDNKKGFLTTKPQLTLVIDSGGGTTDFALAEAEYPLFSFKNKPLTIKDVWSEPVGGRNIDLAIYEKIVKKSFKQNRKIRDEERMIGLIRKSKEEYDWVTKKSFEIQELGTAGTLDYQEFKACVERVIEPIINKASEIKRRFTENNNPIESVILAGGNSKIKFLATKIGAIFSPVSVTTISSPDLQTSVAQGAALYIHHTNERLRHKGAYDIYVKYKFKHKEHTSRLVSKKERLPNDKKKPIQILSNPSSTRELNLNLIFIDKQNTRTEELLTIEFIPPLESLNEVKISFEVDANGYIRYTAEPFRKVRTQQYRGIVRKSIFDTSKPEW